MKDPCTVTRSYLINQLGFVPLCAAIASLLVMPPRPFQSPMPVPGSGYFPDAPAELYAQFKELVWQG